MHVSRDSFEELVRGAVSSLPERFLSKMGNVGVIVADRPTRTQRAQNNLAPDDTLALSESARISGSRSMVLPFWLLYAVSRLAWRLNLRQITEAPAPFLYFAAYPWLASNRRLKEELGFEFRHGSRETLESYLATR